MKIAERAPFKCHSNIPTGALEAAGALSAALSCIIRQLGGNERGMCHFMSLSRKSNGIIDGDYMIKIDLCDSIGVI